MNSVQWRILDDVKMPIIEVEIQLVEHQLPINIRGVPCAREKHRKNYGDNAASRRHDDSPGAAVTTVVRSDQRLSIFPLRAENDRVRGLSRVQRKRCIVADALRL